MQHKLRGAQRATIWNSLKRNQRSSFSIRLTRLLPIYSNYTEKFKAVQSLHFCLFRAETYNVRSMNYF